MKLPLVQLFLLQSIVKHTHDSSVLSPRQGRPTKTKPGLHSLCAGPIVLESLLLALVSRWRVVEGKKCPSGPNWSSQGPPKTRRTVAVTTRGKGGLPWPLKDGAAALLVEGVERRLAQAVHLDGLHADHLPGEGRDVWQALREVGYPPGNKREGWDPLRPRN